MASVTINITTQLRPVTEEGFGLILVYDPTADVAYQEVSAISELTGYASTTDTYKMVSKIFEQSPAPTKVAVYGAVASGAGIATELDDLISTSPATRDPFYFVVMASRVEANIEALGAWCGTNKRIMIAQYSVTETVANIIASIASINNKYSVLCAHKNADDIDYYVDAALAGRWAALTPGTETLDSLRLYGVVPATYTNAEKTTLFNAYANVVVTRAQATVNDGGKTSSGDWADVTRGIDFLESRLKSELDNALVNNDKIPYNDEGIAIINGAINSALTQAADNGILDPDQLVVNVPKIEEISDTDKLNRRITTSFEAVYIGSIQNITVNGTVTV